MRKAILKDLLIDLDFVGHIDSEVLVRRER